MGRERVTASLFGFGRKITSLYDNNDFGRQCAQGEIANLELQGKKVEVTHTRGGLIKVTSKPGRKS